MNVRDEAPEWASHNADEKDRCGAAMNAHLSGMGNTHVTATAGSSVADRKLAATQRMLNVRTPPDYPSARRIDGSQPRAQI